MKYILGKKIGMTQIWTSDDTATAVTMVSAGPCAISQLKEQNRDGYLAVQLAFDEKKVKNIRKPQLGHLSKLKSSDQSVKTNYRYLREFRVDNINDLKIGDMISVETFVKGDKVKVTGISKGRGFQGVVKRHGFSGSKKTHGNKDQLRMPGSVGATGPAHVFKGTRMAGRMGNAQVTETGLEIVDIDLEKNILYISGSIPGSRNGLLLISGDGELVVESPKSKVESQEVESQDAIVDEVKATEVAELKTKDEEQKTEENVVEDKKPADVEDSGVAEEETLQENKDK